ncbi:hypothetical protein G9A89_009777 [Geosiphon pyriformis]|nr:hypothetical protein G9A89_009777 [Geosiphon pyriformis]
MLFNRIIFAQFITIGVLAFVLVEYILYKYDRFKNQPTLIQYLKPENSPKLSMPGLLICLDGAYVKAQITSGPMWPQSNTNFSMPESKLGVAGALNNCWTINTTDPIVYPHQPMENGHLPQWGNLEIVISYFIDKKYQTIFPKASFAIVLFEPLDNPDMQDLPWIYTGSGNKIHISYLVERRTYLNGKSQTFFKDQLIEQAYDPNPQNGTSTIEVRPNQFLIERTKEFQAFTTFSIITEALTFATSVLLTIYFLLFGKSRFHPWGLAHFLLRSKPEYTKVDGSLDTLTNIVVTYLDVEYIKKEALT